MEPILVEKGQILLLGVNFFGDPFTMTGWTEDNEIHRLWKRLEAFLGQNLERVNIKNPGVGYEVWSSDEETAAKGLFDIFAGVEIENLNDVPVELLVKVLPRTQYAVFTFQGEEITSDWPRLIYQEWLPSSGYELAYQYNFQYYDKRFKGVDKIAESVIDVYVPVKSK
jgi:predicted transcriptional regulator YdeE